MDLRQPDGVQQLGGGDEDRISRRMRLVPRDVVVADAEREVDRVEIFQRDRKGKQVEHEKEQREQPARAQRRAHAGRSSSPSFKLPVR